MISKFGPATVLTHFQIFVIGFTFGIAGPCLLSCTPAIITYIAGTKRRFANAFADIIVFLTAKLAAYMVFGYLAGVSASLLRQFTDSQVSAAFRPIGGILSILLGIAVIFYKETEECGCKSAPARVLNFGGIFAFGFLVGITPCPPLISLMSEIMLLSTGGFDGAMYALSFGLGAFLSGLIVIGAISGVAAYIPVKVLKSAASRMIFKLMCALCLILLGLSLIL